MELTDRIGGIPYRMAFAGGWIDQPFVSKLNPSPPGSIRFVREALVSTGGGWLDAEPEIAVIKPDIYAVNEDGHKAEKRLFCREHGIEYVVLKRVPREGLTRRTSTNLRGF